MKKILLFALLLVLASPMASVLARKSDVMNNLTVFNQLFKELNTFYVDTINPQRSIETAIVAMLDEIDPYTQFISAADREAFESQTTGQYAGIGSYVQQRNGDVIISEPRAGSPAQLAGLRAGDHIAVIDGDTVLGHTTVEVSSMLRGQPGTEVNITVFRPYVGADSVKNFTITRQKIIDSSIDYFGVTPDSIGYINISSFNEQSAEEFRRALLDIKTFPGLKGLVIDLRGNGGGLVESAVKILGYFLPKNTEVLRTRGRDAINERIYRTSGQPIDSKLPLAVLIDDGTASASEIVSGALQDLDRAVIIGSRSFGKGLVQVTRPLPNNNLLKVTISKYYIPSGRLIQAIDYSHRNPDGTVARIPDSLTNVFHTAAGREVRDGGGITPDIKIEYPQINRLVYNIVRDNWAFDYATRFRATHDAIDKPISFNITDEIFEDFKSTINPETFRYDRIGDLMIENLRTVAQDEGYMTDSVAAQIEILATLLHRDLEQDLDLNRENIVNYLAPEILSRYYDNAGRIEYNLRYDQAMDSVRSIFNNPEEYKRILRK